MASRAIDRSLKKCDHHNDWIGFVFHARLIEQVWLVYTVCECMYNCTLNEDHHFAQKIYNLNNKTFALNEKEDIVKQATNGYEQYVKMFLFL